MQTGNIDLRTKTILPVGGQAYDEREFELVCPECDHDVTDEFTEFELDTD